MYYASGYFLFFKGFFMNKSIVFLLLLPTIILASGNTFGIAVSINDVYASFNCFPVPVISFYSISNKRIQDFSFEYSNPVGTIIRKEDIGNLRELDQIYEMGITYSYLRSLLLKHLFVGPSIGLQYSLSSVNNKGGLYFFGLKGMFKYGYKHINFIMSDRLLFGIGSFMLSNLIGTGILFAF
jgi:hypothetical protein